MDDDSHLSEMQRQVLYESATEEPGSGVLLYEKGEGIFHCARCNTKLFSSDAKFESGSGWPSFDRALPGAVTEKSDSSHGMQRVEAVCSKCGGHLGHIFDDGPKETTGQRFCINSLSLDFIDKYGNKKSGDGS